MAAECRTLPAEVSAEWDATLSCYAMAYLSVEEVREQLGSIKSRGLILVEPEGYVAQQPVATEKSEGRISCPLYFHDWGTLFRDAGWNVAWRWPVAQIDNLVSLMIAQRG